LCGDRPPERLPVEVVDEPAPALDLDDGYQLAIALLQLEVARDVDLDEVERELPSQLVKETPRPPAEVAVGCVVEGDPRCRYG
jgi:hypothetical protein